MQGSEDAVLFGLEMGGTALFAATALVFAAIWLFYGWRVYWLFAVVLTALSAAIVGWFFVAPHLDERFAYLPPLLLGIAGGALAIPLQRVVAFALTGVLGAGLSAVVAVRFCGVPLDLESPQLLAVAAAGFLIAGIPAAIFLRFLVVFITSGYGALLALGAAAAVAAIFVDEAPEIGEGALVALLVAWTVLTVTGVLVQLRSLVIHKAQAES